MIVVIISKVNEYNFRGVEDLICSSINIFVHAVF